MLKRNYFKFWIESLCLFVVCILLVGSFYSSARAQEPVFILEDMDEELVIGQRAKGEWGHFWSGPAVTGINLGYLAEHGYPEFIVDRNGNGNIDREDLVRPVDNLGGEDYMMTDPDRGTSDPDLLRGLAKYVNEKYPNTFKIKVYEDGFPGEYADVIGERLPEELFGVPIEVFTDPEFPVYERELRGGEMIWLGVPQVDTGYNHFLAGRSFDTRENLSGNFPVDFADPREESFQPGKGQIIETEMTPAGDLMYEDEMRPVDIMIALSPAEKEVAEAETTGGPNLTCDASCQVVTEEVCVQYEEGESVCTDWNCDGYPYECEDPPPGRQKCCDGFWECENRKQKEGKCIEYSEEESAKCSFTVENTGDQPANPHTDELVVNYSGTGCDFSTKRKRLWWQTLAAGASKSASINLDKGSYCTFEQVTCRVDIYDAVDETSENDNENEGEARD